MADIQAVTVADVQERSLKALQAHARLREVMAQVSAEVTAAKAAAAATGPQK